MTIGRTDDPESPSRVSAFKAARLFWTGSRNPSGPAVMVPRQQGRTHERNRPARQNLTSALEPKRPFSNRASFVNSLFLLFVAASGSRFSPRSEGSAATSGPKHRRCNVHNGLITNGPTASLAVVLYPRPGGQLVPASGLRPEWGFRSDFSGAHWLFRPAKGLARAPDAMQDHGQLPG